MSIWLVKMDLQHCGWVILNRNKQTQLNNHLFYYFKASTNGHSEVVKLLLQRNDINVNVDDENGVTALMIGNT